MALSFKERLAHTYDTQVGPDVFGRSPATPRMIKEALDTRNEISQGKIKPPNKNFRNQRQPQTF